MPLTHAAITDKIENNVRDGTSNTYFGTAEIAEDIIDSLLEVSVAHPRERMETFTIESRTGTASSTTSGSLVDATEDQFVAGDVGKMVFNETDKTWAEITTYTDAETVVLSKDIMVSGEKYAIYNNECTSKFQVNISSIGDHIGIRKLEYPKGTRRNWELDGDILTIKVDSVDDSKVKTSGTQPNTEVYIWFKVKHKVSQLTDFAAAVNNAGGYSAGDTSMAINGLQSSGKIEAHQEFTIAKTRGIYRVTAAATISSNAATISFYPGLESTVAHTTVVTLTQSTLTDPLVENLVVDYATALAAIREPMILYQQAEAALTTVAAAATATAAIAARITQAIADVASGRAEADLAVALLSTASTEFDLMNAQIDLGVTALAEGEPIINTVPVAGGAPEFMAQASSDFGAAQGFGITGQSFLAEARANLNNNSAYLADATGEVNAITAKVREVQVNLQEVASELQIASSGRVMESWGRAELERVKARMRRSVPNKYKTSQVYTRA